MSIERLKNQAQEVAYVALRLAELVDQKDLKEALEGSSSKFIHTLYTEQYREAKKELAGIQGLVALGANLGKINLENADLLTAKIHQLKQQIQESESLSAQIRFQPALKEIQAPRAQSKPRERKVETGQKQGNKANERQERIAASIKSAGKMELREIMATFPEISERTIRYDLKNLCESGKLTRHGAGGPGNYYTAS